MTKHFFLGRLVIKQLKLESHQPGRQQQKAKGKTGQALCEADKFQQGIVGGNGTVEIKKCYPLLHSFSFLNIASGIEVITSMIQRQNHFTYTIFFFEATAL